jgi:hypothetical protein
MLVKLSGLFLKDLRDNNYHFIFSSKVKYFNFLIVIYFKGTTNEMPLILLLSIYFLYLLLMKLLNSVFANVFVNSAVCPPGISTN